MEITILHKPYFFFFFRKKRHAYNIVTRTEWDAREITTSNFIVRHKSANALGEKKKSIHFVLQLDHFCGWEVGKVGKEIEGDEVIR